MRDPIEVNEEDLVPKTWSDGKELNVEDWGQREYNSGYKTGFVAGVDRVYQKLMEQAGISFGKDRDNEASLIRNLAKEINKLRELI